jgi:putative flavoprotein involved in K+ transport
VTTNHGAYEAANVIMATGSFQQPKIPPSGARLSSRFHQLHTSQYRRPEALPPGAVLIVGSGQSGCQIAEELYRSGRQVYLSTGTIGRLPRRYRGKDITWWMDRVGLFDQTVDMLPAPKAKFVGNPQLSGRDGGRSLNLHQFYRDGVVLLGHLRDADGSQIRLAPDLKENLALVDKFETDRLKQIDSYIEKNALEAPPEDMPQRHDGYGANVITELDLKAAGITSILWASGYKFDYHLVKLPVFDADGYPFQKRGVTAYPGLYFVGLSWLYKYKSSTLFGVGDDAAYIAADIVARKPL